MSSAENITSQFSGVIPGMVTGQNAVAKTYVDAELAQRDDDISTVSASAAVAQSTIDLHKTSATAHPAESILYTGLVDEAANVKQAIDIQKQRMDNIVASGGNSNIEIVDARGRYGLLRYRLEAYDTQLAKKVSRTEVENAVFPKADKTYVDSITQSLASGSPKGTYATLTALQAAFPTGNTNIYVVMADGKWYYWSGTAWTAGGQYQATSLSDTVNDDIYKTPPPPFILGTISVATNDYEPSTTRIVSSDYFKVHAGSTIKNINSSLVDFAVNIYSSQDPASWVSNSSWLYPTTQFTISTDCYVKIVARNRATNGDITDSVSEIASGISIYVSPSFRLATLEEKTKTLNKDTLGYTDYQTPNLIWNIGSILNGVPNSNANRILSDYIPIVPGIKLKSSDPDIADVAYSTFQSKDESTFIEDSSWFMGREVTTNIMGYARIVMRFSDNSNINNRIDELKSYLSFDTSNAAPIAPKNRLESLETDVTQLTQVTTNQAIIKNPLDAFVKSIMHRGYSTVAPENTLSAYKLAKEKGFSYVEADVRMTSDGVPVLIHDATIDRTSNGTGNIADLTLAQVKSYDFGSWKNSKYANERIPTFEEFLLLCKKLSLHAYIDLLVDPVPVMNIVKKLGMVDNVTWLVWNSSTAATIVSMYSKSRICYISETFNQTVIDTAISMKATVENLFINTYYSNVTTELANSCLNAGIPLEVWTWANNADMVVPIVNKGVSGITSDSLNINEILMKSEGLV